MISSLVDTLRIRGTQVSFPPSFTDREPEQVGILTVLGINNVFPQICLESTFLTERQILYKTVIRRRG